MKTTSLAACLLLAGTVIAQQEQQQPTSREALQARIRAHAEAISRAARIFLDRTRPEAERLAAVRDTEEFVSAEDVAAATSVFLDAGQSAAIRATALAMIEHAVDRNQDVVTEVLRLATSRDTPRPLRTIAVKVLTDLSFSSLTMQQRSADLLPALRTLTQDPDRELRFTAFSILAANGDDFAQQRLIECVRNPATAPLSRAECIRLLGLQLHGDAYPVLYDVLLRDREETTRIEAIRFLGGYAEARPKLLELLRDREQPEPVRMAVLGALHAADPETFPAIAIDIVRDETASDAMRIYGIQAVRQRRRSVMERYKNAAIAPFDEAVAQLARSSKSADVRKAAEAYLRVVRR
jgi:hypothetical protein